MTEAEGPFAPDEKPPEARRDWATAPTPAVRIRTRLWWLLVNAAEGRPRAGVRVAGHGLLLLPLILLTGLALAAVWIAVGALAPQLTDSAAPGAPNTLWWLLASIVRCTTVTATVWLARRVLDRRSFESLGIAVDRRVVSELGTGFALAGAMQAVMFALAAAAGWLRSTPTPWGRMDAVAGVGAHIAWMTLVFALVAWHEELLARGYWLVNLEEGLGRGGALAASSLLFALAHMGNPNASGRILPGLVGAGALLGWAALRSGRLWLPIGIHLGWNLFEGPIFGFSVSGLRFPSLVATEVVGPPLWTGGAFGPEAGLLLVPALGLGVVGVWLATRGPQVRVASAD